MANIKHDYEKKKYVLGQYFTKETVVRRLVNLIFKYKQLPQDIRILEPSFGTGNFIHILCGYGYENIVGLEIDPQFTDTPKDFFLYSLNEK